jgi:hypothetical protein
MANLLRAREGPPTRAIECLQGGSELRSLRRQRQFRCAAAGASTLLAGMGGLSLYTASAAHASMSPGTGSSYAQSIQVTPHDGSLAVGVILGEALAGHTNYVARAQSQGIDLGAIGTSLTSYNCGSQAFKPDQIPQPLETETGAPSASQGVTQQPAPAAGTSQPSFGSTEFVKATSTPYGEADTSFAPINAGPFTVSHVASKAWSGLVGGEREAGATSDIGAISIAGGLVQLSGLHWQTLYPSGGSARPTGSFTMGAVKVGGVSVPANQNLGPIESVINRALGTVGLEVDLPVSEVIQGVQTVSPLQIKAVPNTTRDTIVNSVLNGTQSQQQTVFGGLENGFSPSEPAQVAQALCQSDTPITVASVAIASVNGGGFFSAGLGGVDSSSASIASNPYNLSALGSISLPGAAAPLASNPASVPSSAAVQAPSPSSLGSSSAGSPAVSTPPVSSAPSISSVPPSSSAGRSSAPVSNADALGYAAGGPLLAIGLAGLGLVALLAEGDRRMMRRAQHTVEFGE